jgi:hypothetical protein
MLTKDGDAYILGIVDVGINGRKGENVNVNITISDDRTIEIP